MSYLFIINDGPYGNERSYNAFRTAMSLQLNAKAHVETFLMGDGVANAVAGQTTPKGYYNIERMIKALLNKQGKIKL